MVAPIPHFFPPGAAQGAAFIEVLFTNDTLIAVRVTYILALLLGGTTLYTLGMRLAGAEAACWHVCCTCTAHMSGMSPR
ncbi:hypothetical protein HC928_14740 [bacterium]|nr:hypothetical protein [bacterium]